MLMCYKIQSYENYSFVKSTPVITNSFSSTMANMDWFGINIACCHSGVVCIIFEKRSKLSKADILPADKKTVYIVKNTLTQRYRPNRAYRCILNKCNEISDGVIIRVFKGPAKVLKKKLLCSLTRFYLQRNNKIP